MTRKLEISPGEHFFQAGRVIQTYINETSLERQLQMLTQSVQICPKSKIFEITISWQKMAKSYFEFLSNKDIELNKKAVLASNIPLATMSQPARSFLMYKIGSEST